MSSAALFSIAVPDAAVDAGVGIICDKLELDPATSLVVSLTAGTFVGSVIDRNLHIYSIGYGDGVDVGYNYSSVYEGGTSSVQTEFNKLLNSDYYKNDFGYDCSEIAQDFYNAAGQNGKIYRIEGKNGYINGYEYDYKVEYVYHEVYSDGTYIYDPRYANVPVLKDDYFRALREINPDGFVVFEIKEFE